MRIGFGVNGDSGLVIVSVCVTWDVILGEVSIADLFNAGMQSILGWLCFPGLNRELVDDEQPVRAASAKGFYEESLMAVTRVG